VFARLCGLFAALALVIASVGLYGTVAHATARRTGEIGVRMALGASRTGVVRMVLRQVLGIGVAGIGLGIPVALTASRLLDSFLWGVEPNDPATFAAAAGVAILAVLVAGFLPARRAARFDPLEALRHE
jgi:ABC-type antimicrobial peptide transport system permease subunit